MVIFLGGSRPPILYHAPDAVCGTELPIGALAHKIKIKLVRGYPRLRHEGVGQL
jgi:hypothetical protein